MEFYRHFDLDESKMSNDNLRNLKEGDTSASQLHIDGLFGYLHQKNPLTQFPHFQNVQVVEKSPDVLSDTQQERIMARRKRLDQRLSRKDNKASFEQSLDGSSDRKDKCRMPSFNPVFESAKNVGRYFFRSQHILRSYVTTNCRRRIYRNKSFNGYFSALNKRIENKQWLCQQHMSAKFSRYDQMVNKTLDLHQLTLLLKKCTKYAGHIIQSKQVFVDEIEDQVKRLDDNFAGILESFDKDIDGMAKEATQFSTKLTALYRQEINGLEKTFSQVEDDYTKKIRDLWDDGHAEMIKKDNSMMLQREKVLQEIINNIKLLSTTNLHSFLQIKLIVDNDLLHMTEQLQNMRASFLINAEKLDYNVQIMQLREEEALKMKNKQKRIITKIQDQLARVTNQLTASQKITVNKLKKHKSQYLVMTTDLLQMHQADDQAVKKEWQTFRDCWISNELALRDTLANLILLDRFITQQITNLPWDAPPLWFLTHIGPIHGPRWRATMAAYQTALRDLGNISGDQLKTRLDQDGRVCWAILNGNNRPMASFRSLSLVGRPALVDHQQTNKPASMTATSSYQLPSHILGPILRWIVEHLDFLNEDYMVDVVNQLSWQDRFSFQMQAFLSQFQDFNYDDICQLALFFLKFSYKVNEKQAAGELLDKIDLQEWLRNLTPQEFLHRPIQLNEVFEALHAYLQHKRQQVDEEKSYDLVKEKGRGRDSSADKDYLDCYLKVFDLQKKETQWNEVMYGIHKESKIAGKKVRLTLQTKVLKTKNEQLKSLLRSDISNKDNASYIYPPLWSKMHIVTEELAGQMSQAQLRIVQRGLIPLHGPLERKGHYQVTLNMRQSRSTERALTTRAD